MSGAEEQDPIEALIVRSRRMRRRGELRDAIVLLRQACMLDEWRARPFTLLGVLLARTNHPQEAAQALAHARWLRQRAGEEARARVTSRLLAEVLGRAA